jgi:hypothetical protein
MEEIFVIDNSYFSSSNLTKIVIYTAALYFYLRLPLWQINKTYNMMGRYAAYSDNPISWRQQIIKKYWKVPLVYMGIVTLAVIIPFYQRLPEILEILIAGAFAYGIPFFLLFWPLIICLAARAKRISIEHCRQEDLEYRIASGMASSGDIHGYMHGVKKQEYEKGYWDGYRTPRPRH